MEPSSVLLLPDWGGADDGHWLSHWQARHGYTRVPQHDWARPLRGDWQIQLEEAVLASKAPAVLVAHGLGVNLVAAWAAHSRHVHRVKGALLVAPEGLASEAARAQLPSWWPVARQRLPFASILVASRNDPGCSFEQAAAWAADWGAELVDAGAAGHLDADAGLAEWPEGLALLGLLREGALAQDAA
jgi:hypothetical protein